VILYIFIIFVQIRSLKPQTENMIIPKNKTREIYVICMYIKGEPKKNHTKRIFWIITKKIHIIMDENPQNYYFGTS
jgi:hypothetical protein